MASSLTPLALSTFTPAQRILAWYDRHRRDLPWRAAPGRVADPYAVWLSEIMLQQTTVATVGRYFGDFMTRWPTVSDLAAASLDEVLHGWQGLGYYARARNLHRCAQAVAALPGAQFPDFEAGLRELPGVGAYTAAAIAAIAFDRRATVMDGNVERVMARYFAVEQPLPDAKPVLYAFAESLTPDLRPGDYAQAVMDLGATICIPRKPRCMLCPWSGECRARAGGEPERLPLKRAKAERPVRRGVAFWITRPDGSVLLRRRAEKGLLGGMMEVPSTPWTESFWDEAAAMAHVPVAIGTRRPLPGSVSHTFTHFHLELSVVLARASGTAGTDGVWVKPDRLGDHALPTLMKKVARFALAAGGGRQK